MFRKLFASAAALAVVGTTSFVMADSVKLPTAIRAKIRSDARQQSIYSQLKRPSVRIMSVQRTSKQTATVSAGIFSMGHRWPILSVEQRMLQQTATFKVNLLQKTAARQGVWNQIFYALRNLQ